MTDIKSGIVACLTRQSVAALQSMAELDEISFVQSQF